MLLIKVMFLIGLFFMLVVLNSIVICEGFCGLVCSVKFIGCLVWLVRVCMLVCNCVSCSGWFVLVCSVGVWVRVLSGDRFMFVMWFLIMLSLSMLFFSVMLCGLMFVWKYLVVL